MSRVASISGLMSQLAQAESNLSDEIHKVFTPGRKVWYQVGFSEDPSSWEEMEVVGPYDKYNITLRRVSGHHLRVDARSHRLRTDWNDRAVEEVERQA